jgi:lactoylglutathione lyase
MAKKRPTRTRLARRAAPKPKRPRTDSGLAPGMQTINTYLAVANVAASVDFLERTLGFSRGVVLPDADGQLRYAEMRHGDSVVMLVRKGDASAATGGAPGLYTYVADVDGVLGHARASGAGVTEAEDKPWGDRVAVVTDPDGYRWVLASFKKLVPFDA